MITIYNNIKTTNNKQIDIQKFLDILKNGTIKSLTDNVRQFDKKSQKDSYRKAQSALPVICFSAIFKENTTHSIDNIVEHTNLICLDYDGIDNVDEIFNTLKEIPFIHLIYKSTSGKGLKVVLKVYLDKIVNIGDMTDPEINEEYNKCNKLYYDYIGEILYKHIDVLPDELARDISRCSYISYDDKYYYNRNSQRFDISVKEAEAYNKKKLKRVKVQHNKETTAGSKDVTTLNEVIQYLTDKKIDITDNYNNWIYLAHLCKKTYEPKTAMIKFHQLSKLNPSYDASRTSKNSITFYKLPKINLHLW